MTQDEKDLALNISVDNLLSFTTDLQTVLLELETLRKENKRLKENTIGTFINNCNNSRQLTDINIKNLTP